MLLGDGHWTAQVISIPHSVHPAAESFDASPDCSDDLHLIHTVAGHGVLVVGGRRYDTTPDHVLCVPIHEPHHWCKAKGRPWEMINIHLRLWGSAGQAMHERWKLPVQFTLGSMKRIHRELRQSHRDWTQERWSRKSRAAGRMIALAGEYLDRFGHLDETGVAHDPLMEAARQKIEATPPALLEVTSLAKTAGLSVSQFNRRFHAMTGLASKAYAQRCRQAFAQQLLRDTHLSIGQAAHALGFSDIYYFSRWFKSRTGVAPSVFRQVAPPR